MSDTASSANLIKFLHTRTLPFSLALVTDSHDQSRYLDSASGLCSNQWSFVVANASFIVPSGPL